VVDCGDGTTKLRISMGTIVVLVDGVGVGTISRDMALDLFPNISDKLRDVFSRIPEYPA
jgi:hypothetical protein